MPKKVTEGETDQATIMTCGFVNKQHHGTKGKLEDLACTLPAGHDGVHSAPYKRLVATPVTDEKGRVIKNSYEEVEDISRWSDAAGVPSDQVFANTSDQMTLYQRDMVLQIIQKNPKTTVEQAIAQASQSEEWNQRVR